jgi:two-component system, NarL family, sensor kinase
MPDSQSEVILILVGSTLIILVLTVFAVFALFIGQKRKFLHTQQLKDLTHTYEQEVLKTQLETQAQTFETISQELHDNVGTLLSIAIVHLKGISQQATELPGNNIDESTRLLEEALDILRDISRSVNPDHINRQGLNHSFRNELDRLRRTRVFKTQYLCAGDEFPIPPQHQMIIFRIVQESLNNILKHSGGDNVVVQATFEDPLLEVVVSDNGKGFNSKGRAISEKHSGVYNMKKRAQMIKATLDIESEDNKGTTVRLSYGKPEHIP